jgi:hypothetical protein
VSFSASRTFTKASIIAGGRVIWVSISVITLASLCPPLVNSLNRSAPNNPISLTSVIQSNNRTRSNRHRHCQPMPSDRDGRNFARQLPAILIGLHGLLKFPLQGIILPHGLQTTTQQHEIMTTTSETGHIYTNNPKQRTPDSSDPRSWYLKY